MVNYESCYTLAHSFTMGKKCCGPRFAHSVGQDTHSVMEDMTERFYVQYKKKPIQTIGCSFY